MHKLFRDTCIALIGILFVIPTELRSLQSSAAEPDIRRSVAAVRIADGERIHLDGRVEEPVWQSAIPATGFRQQEPLEGVAATEETAVYLLYDRDNLYIGVILYDSDIDGILAYQKQRDAGLGTDDRFMWILDTFLDGRTGYFFEINPAGLMGDGLLSSGFHRVNKSWDGIWEARTARRRDGWSAEIRIPFRTLNFDPGNDTWGINFQRTVRRKNEEVLWNGHRRNQGLFRPVHAGRLTGLQGMSQGVGLEVTPYSTAGWRNVPETVDPTDFPTDAGFDLSYSVTPSLRAALSINTDFAEVEVDERRVNLTRFPLFFPERRDFFLEGSGVFSFSPRSFVNPFFSRRIGLVAGEQIPITYGARLGGQMGRYEVGFFQVRTGRHEPLPTDSSEAVAPEDLAVARIKRSLFRQSSIGAIYTRRATGTIGNEVAPPDRHTLGTDLDLFTSRFLGNKNLQFEAFLLWNSDPVAGGTSSFGDLSARGVRLNYPNDLWRVHVSYRELGDDWDPAIGFTRRNGFRRLQPTVTFAPRPHSIAAIRQLQFRLQFEYLTDLSYRLETRKTELRLLGIRFESGDSLRLEVTQLFERLDQEFEIHPGDTIPIGDYNTLEWKVRAGTAGRRAVSGNVEFSRGGFWSGDRTQYVLGFTVRPYPGVSLRSEAEKNDVRLPEGDFSTYLLRLIGGWHINPWASVIGNLQYDDVTEVAGLFVRFRWIFTPGSDLFIVYTHNWQSVGNRIGDFDLSTLSQGATTKINYTHRF